MPSGDSNLSDHVRRLALQASNAHPAWPRWTLVMEIDVHVLLAWEVAERRPRSRTAVEQLPLGDFFGCDVQPTPMNMDLESIVDGARTPVGGTFGDPNRVVVAPAGTALGIRTPPMYALDLRTGAIEVVPDSDPGRRLPASHSAITVEYRTSLRPARGAVPGSDPRGRAR